MHAGIIQDDQEIQEITKITNLVKSIPGLEVNNEVDAKDWLENDANDLEFEILNDDEIVKTVKDTELLKLKMNMKTPRKLYWSYAW